MVQIKAHFDGKVFVPDEPVNLHANQRALIKIETVTDGPNDIVGVDAHRDRVMAMVGWANGAEDNPETSLRNVTDDQLWGE